MIVACADCVLTHGNLGRGTQNVAFKQHTWGLTWNWMVEGKSELRGAVDNEFLCVSDFHEGLLHTSRTNNILSGQGTFIESSFGSLQS